MNLINVSATLLGLLRQTYGLQSASQGECNVNIKLHYAPQVDGGYRQKPRASSLLDIPIHTAYYEPEAGADLIYSLVNVAGSTNTLDIPAAPDRLLQIDLGC